MKKLLTISLCFFYLGSSFAQSYETLELLVEKGVISQEDARVLKLSAKESKSEYISDEEYYLRDRVLSSTVKSTDFHEAVAQMQGAVAYFAAQGNMANACTVLFKEADGSHRLKFYKGKWKDKKCILEEAKPEFILDESEANAILTRLNKEIGKARNVSPKVSMTGGVNFYFAIKDGDTWGLAGLMAGMLRCVPDALLDIVKARSSVDFSKEDLLCIDCDYAEMSLIAFLRNMSNTDVYNTEQKYFASIAFENKEAKSILLCSPKGDEYNFKLANQYDEFSLSSKDESIKIKSPTFESTLSIEEDEKFKYINGKHLTKTLGCIKQKSFIFIEPRNDLTVISGVYAYLKFEKQQGEHSHIESLKNIIKEELGKKYAGDFKNAIIVAGFKKGILKDYFIVYMNEGKADILAGQIHADYQDYPNRTFLKLNYDLDANKFNKLCLTYGSVRTHTEDTMKYSTQDKELKAGLQTIEHWKSLEDDSDRVIFTYKSTEETL